MSTVALNRLRQFLGPPREVERCDLCGAEVGAEHEHLLDVAERRLHCACGACAILFERTTTRKRVPRRVRMVPGYGIDDAQWNALGIPISLAFFVDSTPHQRIVAYYPSPAGATESLLSLDITLPPMAADVEALLVNRNAGEYFIAPIDQCYRLVGLIRTQWTGFSGGTKVLASIAELFHELRQRA
jgi:hypothetical protein